MLRTLLRIGLVLCIGGAWAAAQDSGLPAPPKPPKSKAKEAEKAGEKSLPADPSPSPDPGTGARERGHGDDLPRPRRIRIDVPFFHMDLNLGGRGAPREVMPDRDRPADS